MRNYTIKFLFMMLAFTVLVFTLASCKDDKPDDNIGDEHTCVFDKEIATEAYKKHSATCTNAAVYYYSCSCGAVSEETFEHGMTLAHTYNKQITTSVYEKSPATCTDRAEYYYSCICGVKGETSFEYGDYAHNEITNPAIPETCTTVGKTEGKHCSLCGTVTVAQTDIPKIAHSYGSDDICSVCHTPRPTDGLLFTPNADGKSYTVSGIGQATDFKIVIPSEYNSMPVTAIAPSAFSEERWFTDIIIPDSVTSIGANAFYECTGLINAILGDGVASIGANAFYHCTGLKDIRIGTSLASIGADAFKECTGLLYVRITDVSAWCKINFANIGSNPIGYTHSLYLNDSLITDLVLIGSEKIRISKWAFYTCTSLTSLDVQSGIFSIGEQAFYGCSGMETLAIGNGVVIVDKAAFADCDKLKTVTVGKDVTTLNQCAFESCDELASFVMGNGITNLGNRVFYNCAKLTDITWSQIVTSVGDEMLGYCISLKTLDLPASVTYVGERVLVGCTAVETVVLPFIGSSKNLSLGEASQFSYVFGGTIPSALKNITVLGGGIDADDFVGCATVENMTFGSSVTTIDTTSLLSCATLKSITVHDAHTLYASENGILYNKAKTQILFIPMGYTDSLTVTSGNLTATLLNGCSQITDITISSGVNYEDGAFAKATGLKTLTLPTLNTTALTLFGGADNVPTNFETLTITSQRLTVDSTELEDCNFDVVLSAKYIIGIDVSAKSEAYTDEFWNGNENKITVLMNDGTSYQVDLLPEYISNADNELLYTKGTHTVNVTYEGFADTFTTTLANYTFEGITFEDQSIIIDDVGSIYISGKPSFANVSYVGNGQAIDGEYIVTATISAPYYDNLVLSATMTIKHKKYNINYVMGNNGSQNPNASQYTYGTVFTFLDPYYSNGKFVGWYSDSSFTTPITQIPAEHYGEVTVYAKFDLIFTYEGNTITGLGEFGKTLSEITIPSSIDGNAITIIGYDAFSDCQNLKSVIISNGITHIGECAFLACRELVNVEIPSSVTSMGRDAFVDCPVEELENDIAYVGNWAYRVKGTSVTFRDGTIGIADDIVLSSHDNKFTELYIPNTVKYIGRQAFLGCDELIEVIVPNSVVNIGENAFRGCTELQKIIFDAGGQSGRIVGDYAFCGCTKLQSVTIGGNIESIGRGAFWVCTNLQSVTIGNSVTSIGAYAFAECANLQSIAFEDISYWYRTTDSNDWSNKTGGEEVDVTNASTNVTYFAGPDAYNYNYYWYKK